MLLVDYCNHGECSVAKTKRRKFSKRTKVSIGFVKTVARSFENVRKKVDALSSTVHIHFAHLLEFPRNNVSLRIFLLACVKPEAVNISHRWES